MSAAATHLEPEVISSPAETAESEELPLVAAHANVLDGLVDDLGLAYSGAVRSATFTWGRRSKGKRHQTDDLPPGKRRQGVQNVRSYAVLTPPAARSSSISARRASIVKPPDHSLLPVDSFSLLASSCAPGLELTELPRCGAPASGTRTPGNSETSCLWNGLMKYGMLVRGILVECCFGRSRGLQDCVVVAVGKSHSRFGQS